MKNFLKVSLMTAVVAGLMIVSSASNAKADPITGTYSIQGANFIPVNGVTGAVTTLALATGLDFGGGPNFRVASATGSFLSLCPCGITGTTGTILSFAFAAPGGAFPYVPISMFQSVAFAGGLMTFDLTTVSIVSQGTDEHGIDFLSLTGTGVFHMTGLEATVGFFNFTSQGMESSFSFSATQTTVPEPASMLLLGTGLLGAAGAFRRRFRAQS